jgi:hypothetical protein
LKYIPDPKEKILPIFVSKGQRVNRVEKPHLKKYSPGMFQQDKGK